MLQETRSATPSPVLKPFVRAYAERRTQDASAEQPFPAYLESIIEFDFGDLPASRSPDGSFTSARRTNIGGPRAQSHSTIVLRGDIESFAVFLRPTAPWTLFHLPVSALTDQVFDVDDVLGNPMSTLWDELAEARSFAERIQRTETTLLRYLGDVAQDSLASFAAAMLSSATGPARITGLAASLHISVRQLERVFERDIGITPKLFARVARFQRALDSRVRIPTATWSQIASATGYHDQMHLVRDFHELAGYSPTGTLARLGDSRPDALAADTEAGIT